MDVSDLTTLIENSFELGVPPTPPASWSNDSDAILDTNGMWGKSWADLGSFDFHQNMYCFFKFPRKDIPYFVAALMLTSLRDDFFFSDALNMILERPEQITENVKKNSFFAIVVLKCLNGQQRRAFSEYMKYASNFVPPDWKSTYLFASQLALQQE